MDCKLIDLLNQETEQQYNFKLKSASLDSTADFCVIEIFYRDGIILSKQDRESIVGFALKNLPEKYKYEIKFIKNFVSNEEIENLFEKIYKSTVPSVPCKLGEVILDNLTFGIKIVVENEMMERAEEKNVTKVIADEYKKRFPDYEFSCKLESGNVLGGGEIVEETAVEDNSLDFLVSRYFETEQNTAYVGEEIDENPKYIVDRKYYSGTTVFAGRVRNIRDIVYESKKKDKDEGGGKAGEKKGESSKSKDSDSADAENCKTSGDAKDEKKTRERHIFRFNLDDFTSSISCTFFSTKQNVEKLKALKENDEIKVRGNVEYDEYHKDNIVVIKDINFCKLPEHFEEKIVYHEEKSYYEFVKPEKFVLYHQNNLMNFSEEKPVCAHLAGKTYVCYDLETTGVSYETGDKIIEIGAFKIENGKITEKFVSFVNPDRLIPEKASAVNHIFDADVANAPHDYQVLQDFYKFTRGAILVGYNNISFDDVFLIGQGRSNRWNFDNESEDAYLLAQKFVTNIKNHKLITVAKALGVALDNAHSAGWDALATAEVFIKLAEKLDK